MKLTLDEIKSVALGSVLTEEVNGAVRFHRFTAEQEAFYAERKSMATRATSGIKLSFVTDSSSLFLKVFAEKIHSRSYFSVDLFVNGVFFDALCNFDETLMPRRYVETAFPLGEFEKSFELPEGEKEILIHFPALVSLELLELFLSDGASFSPKRPKKKLLCFGDSITEGFDALHPFRRYTARLADFLGMEEFNKGVGGEYFQPALSTLRDDFTPDLITVAYGTNDWSHRTREKAEEACRGFFENLIASYPDTPVLAITPLWRKIWLKEKEFGPFRDMHQLIARITAPYENVTCIDAFDFIPPYSDYFGDLTLHPNGAGYDRYFEGIRDFIEKNELHF